MDIRKLRENINLQIYDSKERNLKLLKVTGILVSVVAIAALFFYHGFELNAEESNTVQNIVEMSFGFFVFRFLARVFYDFSPRRFIREQWFEAALVFILIVEGIGHNVYDFLAVEYFFDMVGMRGAEALSVVFLQTYLFVVIFFELSDTTRIISNIKLHPSVIFILCFLLLIGGGTLLLMLPAMHVGDLSFVDALFTSVSATCVTGLSVVNTATIFTFKGQFVIMMLMKLGGLNIVSFAYLAAILNRVGFGMKQDDIVEDFLTTDALYSAKQMLVRVFFISLLIEAIGAGLIFILLTPDMPFSTIGEKLFFSVFHSVSAFNNGGFSTLPNGFYELFVREAYLIHIVVGVLIVLGAFGFTVLFDLFMPSLLRDRLRHPWKKPHLSTVLAVRTNMVLVIITVILYVIAEWNNTLSEQNLIESTITATFHAVSARSAGLNTADFHMMSMGMLFLFVIMMFIGGNTFSTAGGIKTSTFALICFSTYSIIRGKKNVEVMGRSISSEDMLKAFTVLVTFMAGIVIGVYVLCLTESHIITQPDRGFMDLLFEQVSAFSTCGLSTGITPMLSVPGKYVLIFSMFIGRLGTLTIIFAFARKVLSTRYTYPHEHIMVG